MMKIAILTMALSQLLAFASGACFTPKDVVDFVWNPVDLEPEGYYFPMGSLSSLNPRNNNITLPGVSKNCPARLLWKEGSSDAIFYGCGNQQSHFECNPVDDKLWKLDCKHLSNETSVDLSHRVYGTLTDNRTFAFLNRCFYNIDKQDWIVMSTTKDLPPETKFEIFVHAAIQDYEVKQKRKL